MLGANGRPEPAAVGPLMLRDVAGQAFEYSSSAPQKGIADKEIAAVLITNCNGHRVARRNPVAASKVLRHIS